MKILGAILLLLLVTSPAQAAVLWFAGVETGDTNETTIFGANPANCVTNTTFPHTGGYRYHVSAAACAYQTPNSPLSGTTIFLRQWVLFEVLPSSVNQSLLDVGNGTTHNSIVFIRASDSKLYWGFDNATVIAAGTTALTLAVWHLIEVKAVVSATVGGIELKLDGNTEFSSFGTNTSSIGTFLAAAWGPFWTNVAGSSMALNFDDLMACSSAYCPSGGTIARQGTSGSPTYTAWTKTGCTSSLIENCWSTTPFGTAANASDAVLNDAQTMVVHDFNTTQSGHGTETISGTSPINACKTVVIGKISSAGNVAIRRRLNGSDTDTTVAFTTSDAYHDDGIWTTTTGVLRNSSLMEIGGKSLGTNTTTFEDMWLMCDFAAGSAPTHHKVNQGFILPWEEGIKDLYGSERLLIKRV